VPEPTTHDLPVLLVGDVHGDLQRLFPAIAGYDPQRWHTIFVGDLVDGREFGVGALRFARDRPNTTVLLGNHEIAMLAALDDRKNRGEPFLRWVGVGGQLHDLQELAGDELLQAWLRERPVATLLPDGTLVQHSDNDGLGRLVDHQAAGAADAVEAVNAAAREALVAGDYQTLWDLLSPQHVFEQQPLRLAHWLERTGARRVVHGHTPHRERGPRVYAGGRAINIDGGLARRGRWQGRGPAGASVAPLPP
jgi:Calcineurin-like phosphoesterase